MATTNHLPPAFVTYGWCRTSYTVVRSLGRRGVKVHTGDSSPTAMARYSRYCSSFTKLPDSFSDPAAYFDSVLSALSKTGAQVLMPCHEDVEIFARRKSELPSWVRLAIPNPEAWEVAEDKWLYLDPVQRAGCPVPNTFCPRDYDHFIEILEQVSFPIVLKTRIGNSAKGVRICHSKDAGLAAYHELVTQFKLSEERLPVIQEFIAGEKLGVLGVYDSGRHISSIVFQIRRSKGKANFGTSTFRVTIDDPITLQNSIKAMESLQWHGVVDMDWVRDGAGCAKLIDINGRLGGATALTCFSNMDMPWYWYQIALGRRDFDVTTPKVNTKARWLLGDALGLIDNARGGRFWDCLKILKPEWGCRHDDLVITDPLPFLWQIIDYGIKFLRSGGSTNPVSKGMIR